MTKQKQDYELAVKNTARQIIAIVKIRLSLQKVVDNLNPENFQSRENFRTFLENETKRINWLDAKLKSLIADAKFYRKCIREFN